MLKDEKTRARREAKARRAKVKGRAEKAAALIHHFPWAEFKKRFIAGFAPLHNEIDLGPLMTALYGHDAALCLPVTGAAGTPLSFRVWTPQVELQAGRYGTMEPRGEAALMQPDFIFLPLLAFSPKGERLGYGGGYYDRTIADLRRRHDVFTCGVGFDTQEKNYIPTGPHDIRLDAILTPSGFRRF